MALEGTTAILEKQLLPKEELYKRWVGATPEEIAGHFNKGELRAFERHKGPINGILWCKPGNVYYQDRMDYSRPGLYEYSDDYCDYFLLEDVVRCESAHPEYIGNVTPESLGLASTHESRMAAITALQEQIEGITPLRQWNKRLNESNQRLSAELAEKDVRITELEQQLAEAQDKEQDEDKTTSKASLHPQLIPCLLRLLAWWQSLGESSQQKKHGLSEDEVTEHTECLPRALRRKIKEALPTAGIKIWRGPGARPSS